MQRPAGRRLGASKSHPALGWLVRPLLVLLLPLLPNIDAGKRWPPAPQASLETKRTARKRQQVEEEEMFKVSCAPLVCLSVLKSVRVCVWSSFLPWRAIDWLVRQSGSFIICFLPTMQSALDLASQARAEHADAAAAADADAVSCTTMK